MISALWLIPAFIAGVVATFGIIAFHGSKAEELARRIAPAFKSRER